MRTSLTIMLLATAACGSGAGSGTLGNRGGGGAATLGAALAAEIGAGVPVAIVPTPEGLKAISADGARQRTLVPGPVRWALVDARASVVWFGTDDVTAVKVLDLESLAASPAIATAVTGLPSETDAGPPLVGISYPSAGSDGDEVLDVGHPITPHVYLEVGAEPALRAAGGILEMWEQQEAYAATVAKATISDRAMLQRLAARGQGRSLGGAKPAEAPRVQLEDLSACEDAEVCGQAEIVTPALWRVVTAFSCGDGCYTMWQLYDADAQRLVEDEWAKLISDAWLAPDGSAFVTGGRVVRFDRGPLAATPATEDGSVLGGGWLGGGTFLP